MPTSKNETHFLSLIVPVYKQEKTIVENLKILINVLDEIRYDFEIIVVIDGATDRSYQRLLKARKQLRQTTVLKYDQNRGKAFALRLGMTKAQGDYVMFIDSGFEIDPNGISMLIEHMEWYDADVIVGSKRHPASHVNYTWERKLLSYGYYYIVKLLFGISVRDTQAGIKIFKKAVLAKVLPRLVEKRFAGDLEMLVVAKQLGFKRIFEAPIKLNYQFSEITSAATWRSIFHILVDTVAILYRSRILQYYQQVHHRLTPPDDLKTVRL